jgi:hypothetical protein
MFSSTSTSTAITEQVSVRATRPAGPRLSRAPCISFLLRRPSNFSIWARAPSLLEARDRRATQQRRWAGSARKVAARGECDLDRQVRKLSACSSRPAVDPRSPLNAILWVVTQGNAGTIFHPAFQRPGRSTVRCTLPKASPAALEFVCYTGPRSRPIGRSV